MGLSAGDAGRGPTVGFCPVCGAALGDPAFVQEYWVGEDRQFLCWCAACRTMTTVVLSPAVVSHEPEH